MQKLVSAVLATLLLATGSTLAIAQNSSNNNASPAPTATASTNSDVVVEKHLRHLEGTIAKTAKQQEAERRADVDRTDKQLKDLGAKQYAQVKADARFMADQQTAQAKADAIQLHKLELVIATVAMVVITLLVVVIRKKPVTVVVQSAPVAKEEIPELPPSATDEQVRAFAKANNKGPNEKFGFRFDVKIDDPNDLKKSIVLGQIEGEVSVAEDDSIWYTIDGHDVRRGKMPATFRDTFYERARKEATMIHVVRVA